MPSRRAYLSGLGSLGSALGLAGCLGDGPTATETNRSQPHSFGTDAPVVGATVTPSLVHTQSSVLWISNVDWADVVRLDDEWVVFVTLSVRGDSAPPRDAFSLVAGDVSFAAREHIGDAEVSLFIPDDAVQGRPYGLADRSTEWLAFTVPAGFESAPDLALQVVHDGATARWSLPAETRDRIAGTLPTFDVLSFEVPERVPSPETAEVTVTARNTSDVGGVLRGCINTTGLYSFHEMVLPVKAGSEATWMVQLRASDYAPGGGAFSCNLRTAGGYELERTVEVLDDQTTTAATPTTSTAREQS